MKKYPTKTEYYTSFRCDFDKLDLEEKKIGRDYSYIRNTASFRIARFVLYRIIATPIAFIYSKLIMRDKVHGKDKLRTLGDSGCFIYANHTQETDDAFAPNVITFPKNAYIIVNSKNYSLPIIGKLLPYLGAIPVPTDISAASNFISCIKKRVEDGGAIVIYPEAHVWPFMTKLRPFGSESFLYPARLNAPSFSLTRVYKRHGRGYRCEIYIDGPFYPDPSLSVRDAAEKLTEEVRAAMKKRCRESDIEVIHYEGVSEDERD